MSSVFYDRGRFLNTCCHNGPIVFFGIVLISIPLFAFLRSLVLATVSSSTPYSSPILIWILHILPFLLAFAAFIAVCWFIRHIQASQSEQQPNRGPSAGFIAAVGSPEPYARMYGTNYISLPQSVQTETVQAHSIDGQYQEAPIPIIGQPKLVCAEGPVEFVAPHVNRKKNAPMAQVKTIIE
jgi:hypothetical protein